MRRIQYRVWDVRLAIAHRLLRSCQDRLGTTYSRRVFRVARLIATEPIRVGKDSI